MGKAAFSLLLICILCLGFVSQAKAQGIVFPPQTTQGSESAISSAFPNPFKSYMSTGIGGPCDIAFRVGGQKLSFSANFPVPNSPGLFFFDVAEMDFELKNTSWWMGSVIINKKLTSSLGFRLEAGGNLTRNTEGAMNQLPTFPPWIGTFVTLPVTWTGVTPRWWQIDVGGSYQLTDYAAFIAGYQWEKFTAELTNPRSSLGGLSPFFSVDDVFTGDVQLTSGIPYFGFLIEAASASARLIYSPFPTISTKFPLRASTNIGLGTFFASFEENRYKLDGTGQYFQGDVEYRCKLPMAGELGFWTQGSYMKISGSSSDVLTFGGDWPTPPGPPPTVRGSGENSSVTRTIYSGGVSAHILF